MSGHGLQYDPNLVDENRGTDIYVLAIVFSVILTLSTSSRVIVKLINKIPVGGAEYFNLIALAFNLTANALEIRSYHLGLGRHLQFIPEHDRYTLKQLSTYNVLFATITLWAVKVSICFFIAALIRGVHHRSMWVIYGLVFVTTATTLASGIVWGLQATPLESLWNPDVHGEIKPVKTLVNAIIVFTAINSVTDLFYALSPVYFFGSLQMDLSKRITIIALTGSGLLVFIFSILRAVYATDFYNPDFTWGLHNDYLYTVIERNLAEFVADLPALHSLIRGLHRKVQTIRSRNTRDTNEDRTAGSSGRFRSTGKHAPSSYKRYEMSNDDTIYNNDDEIPLNDAATPPKDDRIIHMETTIDVETHTAGTTEQEENTQELVSPWDKTRNNVSAV